MYTNIDNIYGILLNKEKINLCKKTSMSTISISIDGLPNTHDNFRHVVGAYNTIVNNIKELKKANFVEHIQITYTVTKIPLVTRPHVKPWETAYPVSSKRSRLTRGSPPVI